MSAGYRGNPSIPSALVEFERTPRWVAWREQDGCKVPFDPETGRYAKANDPETWSDYRAAAVRSRRLVNGHGKGGVGIMLGPVDGTWSLCGIDLDGCRDAQGELTPWAKEIVERFDTYAEVSPGQRGAKAYFVCRTADVEHLGGKLGRSFKIGQHTGVELYLGARYFAVTGKRLDGTPDGLARVSLSELEWLIDRATALADDPASGWKDRSGSGAGDRFMYAQVQDGATFDEACDAILADDGQAGDWANRVDERQLERAWDHAQGVRKGHRSTSDRMPDSDEPAPAGLPLLSPEDCGVGELPPYVVKGLISKGDIVCIVGAPAAGKSLLAPYLGYCVAQGEKAFGLRVRRGTVVYVAAESPHTMRGRVSALRRVYGAAPDFHLSTTVRDLLRKGSPDLANLKVTIEAVRPLLVVIDTLSRAFPGLEENDAAAMGRVVAIAEDLVRLGPAVAIVHHDTKDGQQRLPRGHGNLNAALDASIVVEQEEGGVVRCTAKKVRNGEDGWGFGFAIKARTIGIDDDGDSVRAAYAEELDRSAVTPRKGRPSKAAAAALSILVELHDGRASVSEDEWREACVAGRKVSGSEIVASRRTAFWRAAQDLVRLERVTFADGAYSLEGIEQ